MSRHFLKAVINNDPVEIQIGWDAPLQYFYLVIEKDSDGDIPFYSNIFDDERGVGELNYFIKLLSKWKIKLPDQLIKSLEDDRINNTMNTDINWDLVS